LVIGVIHNQMLLKDIFALLVLGYLFTDVGAMCHEVGIQLLAGGEEGLLDQGVLAVVRDVLLAGLLVP